ncbi:heterokaryon incompatibility protein-domain-containing protein, partial [Cercophora newfieldiana]
MRLINCKTFLLEEVFNNIPPYAILSHTWGPGELTLQDWLSGEAARNKPGYAKIEWSCKQAQSDGIGYLWVDTCCIDKTSSSELSEAINSMFAWYRDSSVCYAFLADVGESDDQAFRASRWFTRGWTLQELIAPADLVFYSKTWTPLGTKFTKRALLSSITGIDSDYLRQPKKIHHASISRRMSWMANRTTTRVEDIAYCMLGIFGINMALLYGEGARAFLRLQEEIIKVSDDQTIFCWQDTQQAQTSSTRNVLHDWASILAPFPAVFQSSSRFFPRSEGGGTSAARPYSITNRGLQITAPL